ncbi:MAG: glycosyltransferase family 4 protein [Chthoniobacteraceae bacterium]
MKIFLLTPGTGSYHCGVCMRDNALAKELHRQGHDAVMLPMYLPLALDETPASPDTPIFFGGINVYLQQKFAFFRHTPRWFDAIFNQRWLLKLVAGSAASQTGGADIGELTHSMLLGEDGRQSKELDEVVAWMRKHGKPDAVWLSTALLAGLARRIVRELGIPVLGSLQGEDSFLDSLAEPWRTRCWETLAERSRDVAAYVAPSRYYADLMGARMRLAPVQLRVIPNGIAPDDFTPAPQPPPLAIGYLARMIAGKGLGTVVDAFILLKNRGHFPQAKLLVAGAVTASDESYVSSLKEKLNAAGCGADAEFQPNVSREEKAAFLRRCTLLSVPATYGEAFGLYIAEAWASGVPVVQPRCAAFPELIEATGAGALFEPANTESLVEEWEKLFADPAAAHALGAKGRSAVERDYSIAHMAGEFVALTRESIDAIPAAR